jgi:hypothetical protein
MKTEVLSRYQACDECELRERHAELRLSWLCEGCGRSDHLVSHRAEDGTATCHVHEIAYVPDATRTTWRRIARLLERLAANVGRALAKRGRSNLSNTARSTTTSTSSSQTERLSLFGVDGFDE